jgi:hypothetical protein
MTEKQQSDTEWVDSLVKQIEQLDQEAENLYVLADRLYNVLSDVVKENQGGLSPAILVRANEALGWAEDMLHVPKKRRGMPGTGGGETELQQGKVR